MEYLIINLNIFIIIKYYNDKKFLQSKLKMW